MPTQDEIQLDLFDSSNLVVPGAASAGTEDHPSLGAPPPALPPVGNVFRAAMFRRPVRVLQGIADPVRFKVLKLMADGSIFNVKDLAKKLNAHPDTMGKHVKVLRTRGLLVSVRPDDSDGRKQLVQIPEEFRSKDSEGNVVLDFGICVLRLD